MESLLEKFIIWRYIKAGLIWGDWESYSYMSPDGINPEERRLTRWEGIYSCLGYDSVPRAVWVGAGGYGKPYKTYLRKVALVEATNL